MMFSHIMIGADDIELSKKFYDAIMAELGHPPGVIDETGRCFYRNKGGVFALTKPIDGNPACGANGGTIGFAADSTEAIDNWHKTGLTVGGAAVEDPPGVRSNGKRSLYLAYLRDPSGNKICALKVV